MTFFGLKCESSKHYLPFLVFGQVLVECWCCVCVCVCRGYYINLSSSFVITDSFVLYSAVCSDVLGEVFFFLLFFFFSVLFVIICPFTKWGFHSFRILIIVFVRLTWIEFHDFVFILHGMYLVSLYMVCAQLKSHNHILFGWVLVSKM